MTSDTLERMEKVLAKILARPIAEIIAELQEIADRDSKNPAPHLAMTIVSGFYGISHLDLADARKHLANAGNLLKAHREKKPEWKFSNDL